MFLNCHTGFSFKYGTMPVKTLFDEARRCDVHKLVITEIHNTASYLEMLRLCDLYKPTSNGQTRHGETPYELDLAVGIEFRNDHELLFIAIAKNNDGFEEINRLLSHHNAAHKPFRSRAPILSENVFIIYPYEKLSPSQLRANEFLGIKREQLRRYDVDPLAEEYATKFVILHPVTFLPPAKDQKGKISNKDFNTHRLLRAIAKNTLLSKLPEQEQAQPNEYMISENEIRDTFAKYPKLIENTQSLLDACSITCKLGDDKNKKYFTASKHDDLQYLRRETEKGYSRVYGNNRKIWNERIEKELAIIDQKGFTSYYLIAYDLINYARSRNFDYVGRGSGANSAVAYCLGITNVDPIELNLYFERFLNEERTSPPDFDLDFSWDNRDDIYDYLFSKYSHDHVCLLGTHVTYQWRSVLRELAKVFGLPKEEIDEIVEFPASNRERDHITSLVFKYAEYIVSKELPSNLSIHAGGVIITEEPIYRYTATDMPRKGYPVSHFEMHNAEDFGLYKFDILSQRGLGHIKETVKHVKQNQGIDVDVYRFREFKDDPKIKALLRSSKTIGCFYVESPAMRMLLGKLKCEDYLTLVAASSIIRPGVASSGMMRSYIERFHAVKKGVPYESIHPKMDELMAETFGVMVYQEDVIKVAHEFAGLSLTEADVLRRGMSGKYRSREEFQKVKDRFFEECKKKNYEQKVIDRVWFEIESFSGYSFAKGHSASYAVESYQSLFLKAHFPLEFMVGVINNFGGFYKTEFYFHEARMNGATIEPPCVNHSNYLTTISGTTIYVGFIHIKGLETKVAQQIAITRQAGEFKNLNDFLNRISLGIEQTRLLIRIGALRFTGKSKQQLMWEAMLYFSNAKSKKPGSELFQQEQKAFDLPTFERNNIEDVYDEIEILGFPICDPFQLLAEENIAPTRANKLLSHVGKSIQITGYLVTTKNARTRSGDSMLFGTFHDKDGEVFDTVHFPDSAKKSPFRGRGFYRVHGKVVEDFGVAMIEVFSMEKVPMINKRAEEFLRESNEAAGLRPLEKDMAAEKRLA